MSSKAYFAPFALILKLCDPQGGDHDWDDDDDETVEEGQVDGGGPELDCGIADADVADAGVGEDGGVIGCELLRGLYKPGSCEVLSDDVQPYAPRYPLWSDGAQKERFVVLPPNARIDATDPDFWVYPVGTRLYKTFLIQGVKLETRIIEKTDAGWTFQTFPWREDQRGVEPAVPEGREDVLGTLHDLPSEADCLRCHTRGGQDGINGFSAIQLNHEFTEYSLRDLVDDGRLRMRMSGEALIEEAVVPGSPLAQDALGYMHANCGICHGGPTPRAMLGMRVRVSDREVRDTDVYKDSVNKPLATWIGPRQVSEDAIERPFKVPYVYRIIAGHPDKSGIVARMNALDPKNRMPPLASELVDTQGVAVVSAWISSLQPRIIPRFP